MLSAAGVRRLQAVVQTLSDAASSIGVFSNSQAAAYWGYHITRSSFFALQGIAGGAFFSCCVSPICLRLPRSARSSVFALQGIAGDSLSWIMPAVPSLATGITSGVPCRCFACKLPQVALLVTSWTSGEWHALALHPQPALRGARFAMHTCLILTSKPAAAGAFPWQRLPSQAALRREPGEGGTGWGAWRLPQACWLYCSVYGGCPQACW